MNELESVDIFFMSRHPKRISSSEVTASQSWQKIKKIRKIKKSQDILYPYQLSRSKNCPESWENPRTLCAFVGSDPMTFRTLYYACLNVMTILTSKKNVFLIFCFFLCFFQRNLTPGTKIPSTSLCFARFCLFFATREIEIDLIFEEKIRLKKNWMSEQF